MPSFILINPTVWPQYINVTDRQDRQWSDSMGRTVLQTVVQKTPGLVTSYDIKPGNGEGLFFFWHFITLSLTYLLRHLPTYLQPWDPHWAQTTNHDILRQHSIHSSQPTSDNLACTSAVNTHNANIPKVQTSADHSSTIPASHMAFLFHKSFPP